MHVVGAPTSVGALENLDTSVATSCVASGVGDILVTIVVHIAHGHVPCGRLDVEGVIGRHVGPRVTSEVDRDLLVVQHGEEDVEVIVAVHVLDEDLVPCRHGDAPEEVEVCGVVWSRRAPEVAGSVHDQGLDEDDVVVTVVVQVAGVHVAGSTVKRNVGGLVEGPVALVEPDVRAVVDHTPDG